MQFPLFAVLAAVASAVVAVPSISSIDTGIPSCVLSCTLSVIPQSECKTITNYKCFCSSAQFQKMEMDCFQSKCGADDIERAIELQKEQCA